MNLLEKAAIMHYHRHRLDLSPSKAQGWRDPQNQHRRFEVLCSIGDLSGCSILDLGCGLGDLKPFLDQRFTNVIYLGVDHLPEFIAQAEQQHGHKPNTTFVRADMTNAIYPQSDYVIASGSLSYRSSDPTFTLRLIQQMWSCCRYGLAFNILDANHFAADALLAGCDPIKIHQACSALTEDCTLIQGYLPDDFTILMRRSRSTQTMERNTEGNASR